MDRFIDVLNAAYKDVTIFKIQYGQIYSCAAVASVISPVRALKSNMDRFIVITLDISSVGEAL